jgi:hypothetical protein
MTHFSADVAFLGICILYCVRKVIGRLRCEWLRLVVGLVRFAEGVAHELVSDTKCCQAVLVIVEDVRKLGETPIERPSQALGHCRQKG